MSDLIVEVDEAMKQERLQKLWQSYGGFFIGLIVALILGTAANAGYQHWKSQKNIAQTDIYVNALIDEQTTAENLAAVSQKIEGKSLKAITQIHAAGLALKEGNAEKAVSLYPAQKDINPALQSLSQIMATTQNTGISAKEKLARLKTLYDQTNNPWRFHAHLEAALVNAHDIKDFKTAQMHLKTIVDAPNIPQTLQKKAQSLKILYALKQSEQ